MLADMPVDQIKPADDHKDDLLIASEKYMSDKIDIDELERIQHLHARKLREVVLELAYPSRPDWLRSFLACFHKS